MSSYPRKAGIQYAAAYHEVLDTGAAVKPGDDPSKKAGAISRPAFVFAIETVSSAFRELQQCLGQEIVGDLRPWTDFVRMVEARGDRRHGAAARTSGQRLCFGEAILPSAVLVRRTTKSSILAWPRSGWLASALAMR